MAELIARASMVSVELKDPVMSDNARYIAETRYGMKDKSGKLLESVKDVFWRVARAVAGAEINWGGQKSQIDELAVDFYNLMAEQKFFPNTPCLVNAGKSLQQLSACFVLPIEDSMESIVETMGHMVMIHKSGGGTGFSFSRLRPHGDYISTSGGTTVGPVSFLQAYNDVTSQIKQGGVRRGANMGMLSIDHPDVFRFAVAKLDELSLTSFNISLAVTDVFMMAIERDKRFCKDDQVPEDVVMEIKKAQANRDTDEKLRLTEEGIEKLYDWAKATKDEEGYDLINPRTGEVAMRLNAYKVFNLVTRLAWQYGDPGLVFIDRANDDRSNPVPKLGRIEATNPCGEQPLLPYDACNLGSINLSNFVLEKGNGERVDWDELARVVDLSVRFLDNVVEINEFPVAKIRDMVTKTRRIGLGVMGFADALFKLNVAYDSQDGLDWAEKFMSFVDRQAKKATTKLAETRGVFSSWQDSVFVETEYKPRNMALTTIAPTGTISMVADASSGIEPIFSLGYQKNTTEGKVLHVINPILVSELKTAGIYSQELLEKIVSNGGKVTGIKEVPVDMQKVFITALEIDPEWHIKTQAAFQKHVDNAISKTINFPNGATVGEVRRAYLLAYELGTKGITVYRSGSRQKEVLTMVESKSQQVAVRPVKKKTPVIARGVRIKKACDMGNVYTSVFFESGDGPVEVFVTLGKSGGYMAGAAEVSGRLASLALKYGAGLGEVADELVGIACGQKTGMGNGAVLSMFDAVGKSLLEISQGEQLTMFEIEKKELDTGKKSVLSVLKQQQTAIESKCSACPDCGSPMYAVEGCFKCSNGHCGYSRCS